MSLLTYSGHHLLSLESSTGTVLGQPRRVGLLSHGNGGHCEEDVEERFIDFTGSQIELMSFEVTVSYCGLATIHVTWFLNSVSLVRIHKTRRLHAIEHTHEMQIREPHTWHWRWVV